MSAAVVQTYTGKPARNDKRKQHRWRVRASNGNKLANGGEGYNNEADMVAAMRSTRNALDAFLAALD